jgi:hypothetical protein
MHPAACTYMLMRIINYTNVCVAQCDYCAFYKLPGQDGGYVLSHEQVFAKLDELLALGGDLAGFNGGFNPHLPLDYYCDLFRAIRARYGDRLEFYALTIAEFMYLADHANLTYPPPPSASKPPAFAGSPAAAPRSSPKTSAAATANSNTPSPNTSKPSAPSSTPACAPPPPWSSASTKPSKSASSTSNAPALSG